MMATGRYGSLSDHIFEPSAQPSGFQLAPEMGRQVVPDMSANMQPKSQLGAPHHSLAVAAQRSHFQAYAQNDSTLNSAIGRNGTSAPTSLSGLLGEPLASMTNNSKTSMNATTTPGSFAGLPSTEHMEDLAYWNPQSMHTDAMMQRDQWGPESSISQQIGYPTQAQDYSNLMMMTGLGEVASADVQGSHLQDLDYWNALQMYGQAVQSEHAPQLPYYQNGHQFAPTPLPEVKVKFCSCGKPWVEGANFCANCGAKRPAEDEEEGGSISVEVTEEGVKETTPKDSDDTIEPSDPDARAISEDIAAQVARFLQGDACESDDEEDGEDISVSSAPQESGNTIKDGLSEENMLQFTGISNEQNRKSHPNFVRGSRFAETFKHVPLNLDGQDLQLVADTITACVEVLYQEKSLPLVRSVQKLLYMRGHAKRIVQCVLGICVHFPDRFDIWLPLDMEPCILLPHRSLEEAGVATTGAHQARYEYDFLMELAAWVHKALVPPPLTHGAESSTSAKPSKKKRDSGSAPSARPSDSKQSLNSVRNVLTLMLRNIPPSLSNAQLEKEIQNSGFNGAYDFIHCPWDLNKGAGAGYAFVNFVSTELAYKFAVAWHSSHRFGEATAINVAAAEQQGLEANLKRWSGSRLTRLKNPNRRPIVRSKDHTFAQTFVQR